MPQVITTTIRPGVTDVRTVGAHTAITDHSRMIGDGRHSNYAVQYSAPIGPELHKPAASLFRTQTGQTGLSAYSYELAAIGNELRSLQDRYAKLVETIATEMPDSATGSQQVSEDLTLSYEAPGLRQQLRMSTTLTKANISYVGEVLKSIDQSADDYKPVDPDAPVDSDAPALTPASLEIFLAYAEDAGNWNGNPWVDGNVSLDAAGRGNLTDLKRKGLLETQHDDGDAFVVFTDAGKALAAQHGIDLSWING